MGHAGHQPAERGQLFREDQLTLGAAQVLQGGLQLLVGRGQFGGAAGDALLQFLVEALQFLGGLASLGLGALEPLGHAVKGRGQPAEFARARVDAGARAQVARLEEADRAGEFIEPAHDRPLAHQPGGDQGEQRGQGEQHQVAHEHGPSPGQGLLHRDAQTDHQVGEGRALEMEPLERVQAAGAVHAGLEKGALLGRAGHARDHPRQVLDPGVLAGLREAGQAGALAVGEGEHRLFGQAEVVEDAAERTQVEGGDEHTLRSAVVAGHRLGKLDHHPVFGFAQGVVADGEAVVAHRAPEKGAVAEVGRTGGGRGRDHVAGGINQGERDIGLVAAEQVDEQGLAGGRVETAHLGGPGQGDEQQAGVVHHPLVVRGHGLHLLQAEPLGRGDHVVAQFAPGVEDDGQGRQHGEQHDQEQTAANGGEQEGTHDVFLRRREGFQSTRWSTEAATWPVRTGTSQ